MIICAAIKIISNKTNEYTILCGLRHGDCFKQLKCLGLVNGKDYTEIEQGFINSNGEFINRKDAYKYALDIGQLSKSTIQLKQEREEDELYSEDLY